MHLTSHTYTNSYTNKQSNIYAHFILITHFGHQNNNNQIDIIQYNYITPQPSEENRRDFTDEQLKAGDTVINLQYGTNRGANQSGLNFGNTRHM